MFKGLQVHALYNIYTFSLLKFVLVGLHDRERERERWGGEDVGVRGGGGGLQLVEV